MARFFVIRRSVVAAGAGVLTWWAWMAVMPAAPVWLRFAVAWAVFVVGPGLVSTAVFAAAADRLERAAFPAAAGIAVSPLIAHGLYLIHADQLFPHIAAALTGVGLERVWTRPAAAKPSPAASIACAAVVSLALVAAGAAYAHRLEPTPAGLQIRGQYDSYDSSFYAAMSAELTHYLPPQSPFRAGHPLNYSWYPELLLAMVHRFGGVPLLDLYFQLAWPMFLITLAAAAFAAVRRFAGAGAAALAVVLVLLGSDLSYIAAPLWRDTPWWDGLIWSTNWLTPGAELLYFNSWTPGLAVMFLAVWAFTRGQQESDAAVRRRLIATAMICFALLMAVKPFAFAVVVGGLIATAAFGRPGRDVRWRLLTTAAGSILLALPWIVNAAALYEDSQSSIRPGIGYLTVLPPVVIAQLDLESAFGRLAASHPMGAAALGIVSANLLFFICGLGVRLIGVPEIWRTLRAGTTGSATWKLLAWMIVVGALIPLFVVTEPYHQTFMWTQTSFFLMWIFVAHAAWTTIPGSGDRVTRQTLVRAAVIVLAAIPSTVHYLQVKWHDKERPFWTISQDLRSVVEVLQQEDAGHTVVLQHSPRAASVIPILTGQRVLLAWDTYARGSASLAQEIDNFFQSARGDACEAWTMLSHSQVTHVLATTSDRIDARLVAHLQPAVMTPTYRLYRVPQDWDTLAIGRELCVRDEGGRASRASGILRQ